MSSRERGAARGGLGIVAAQRALDVLLFVYYIWLVFAPIPIIDRITRASCVCVISFARVSDNAGIESTNFAA